MLERSRTASFYPAIVHQTTHRTCWCSLRRSTSLTPSMCGMTMPRNVGRCSLHPRPCTYTLAILSIPTYRMKNTPLQQIRIATPQLCKASRIQLRKMIDLLHMQSTMLCAPCLSPLTTLWLIGCMQSPYAKCNHLPSTLYVQARKRDRECAADG